MRCDESRDRLSPLLDREVSGEELESLRHHLEECPACCRELALLCCADAQALDVPFPAPAGDLWERVRSAAGLPERRATPEVPALADGEVLTPEEAARFLRVTLEALTETVDSLPHFRIGGQLRFRKRSLEAWMEMQERSPETMRGPNVAAGSGGEVVDFMAARARLTRMGRM
ncbi:MAG: zf-HC2 domain-containing protein [Armatimonadetes bacterium]|nr:zf-HC2 domain-containing protein [Armatimonadota bacterium]